MDRWIPPRNCKCNWLINTFRFVPTPSHLDRCPPVGLSDKEPKGLRYRFRAIGGNSFATATAAASLPHDRYQLLGNGRGDRRGRRVGATGAFNYGSCIHEVKNNQNVKKTETTTKLVKFYRAKEYCADRSYNLHEYKHTHDVQRCLLSRLFIGSKSEGD